MRAASKGHYSHIWLYVKTSSKFLDGIKGLHQIKITITITITQIINLLYFSVKMNSRKMMMSMMMN